MPLQHWLISRHSVWWFLQIDSHKIIFCGHFLAICKKISTFTNSKFKKVRKHERDHYSWITKCDSLTQMIILLLSYHHGYQLFLVGPIGQEEEWARGSSQSAPVYSSESWELGCSESKRERTNVVHSLVRLRCLADSNRRRRFCRP